MKQQWELPFGASYLGSSQCRFRVWAPCSNKVELLLMTPQERLLPMERGESGYYELTVDGVDPGTLYRYRLDGIISRPDPASRSQPQGVHGPSQVVDPGFDWSDGSWIGPQLSNYIIYELHAGTFSAEGTFDAIIAHLDELQDLGITAIELMPVAQFPGDRNWGYDGVFPFAVQSSYGGPGGLKRLVNGLPSTWYSGRIGCGLQPFGP